ncbi:hypothetical protein FVEN_g4508 [Fusarium venenatum]|nr:hypothetical protein FVEN_g4508 [Fusarium venenatum]
MKHLLMLYRALETLPHVRSITPSTRSAYEKTECSIPASPEPNSQIDGFLGYSEELLDILHHINMKVSTHDQETTNADVILDRLNVIISRDVKQPPRVSISSLSSQADRDFALCNKVFQQATLIQLYRQLYGLPSSSEQIQTAIHTIHEMIQNMAQGEPCHTWVAMAMPLFTVGCEAYDQDKKTFILDKINKLEICIGSLHVKIIEQALKDIWKLREDFGDYEGNMCAEYLLERLSYNIVLF